MSYLHVKSRDLEHFMVMIDLTAPAGSYYSEPLGEWVGDGSPTAVTVSVARRFLRLIRETKTGLAAVVRREDADACHVGPWPATFRVKGGVYRFEEIAQKD